MIGRVATRLRRAVTASTSRLSATAHAPLARRGVEPSAKTPAKLPAKPAGEAGWMPGPPRGVAFPEMAILRDVQILPSTSSPPKTREAAEATGMGGPVWPQSFEDSRLRYRSRGFVADRMLAPVERPEAVIEEPCIWGGYLHTHFGHLIAEHLGRLLWARHMWPAHPAVFVAKPRTQVERLPSHVGQILEWYGVRPSGLHVVDRPTLVRELCVAAQAEPYRASRPSPSYLDLLDEHVRRSGLRAEASDVLYVTRANILATLRGGHVGETYVVRVLGEAGARVLDPAALPLRQQLAAYAGARHLVFAEGSAVHGRQLLGRIDQRITVVNRRVGSGLARKNLAPRCSRLAYVAPNRLTLMPVMLPGHFADAYALTFYDVPKLHEAFADMGVPLARLWSQRAYEEACEAELATWAAAVRKGPHGFDVPATLAALQDVMTQRPLEPA
jgi:hypothetical protein